MLSFILMVFGLFDIFVGVIAILVGSQVVTLSATWIAAMLGYVGMITILRGINMFKNMA